MFLVEYWSMHPHKRKGMLAFRTLPDGRSQALGGFDPGKVVPAQAITVVTTDDVIYEAPGWVHPDQIVDYVGRGECPPDFRMNGRLANDAEDAEE